MKKRRLRSVVSAVILIIVLLLLGGLLYKFFIRDKVISDGITVSTENYIFKNFDTCEVEMGSPTRFYITSISSGTYFVQVQTYIESEDYAFDYAVDGKPYKYSSGSDVSLAFDIEAYDGYFTFVMPQSINDVLEEYYTDSDVSVTQNVFLANDYYFKLIVSTSSGEEINILLKQIRVAPDGITELPDIVFSSDHYM